MRESLYLVGFMASGKSTVGVLLAAELKLPFLDVDTWIEERLGCSVSRLFREHGERHFRGLESRALARLAGRRAVIAAGGGLPLRRANRRLLRASGFVLWLQVPFPVIWSRASRELSSVRPLWTDRPLLRARHAERLAAYRSAHLALPVGDLSPAAAARAAAAAVAACRPGLATPAQGRS